MVNRLLFGHENDTVALFGIGSSSLGNTLITSCYTVVQKVQRTFFSNSSFRLYVVTKEPTNEETPGITGNDGITPMPQWINKILLQLDR